jgi:proteasome assembly chaperone (PAC2) family protein
MVELHARILMDQVLIKEQASVHYQQQTLFCAAHMLYEDMAMY